MPLPPPQPCDPHLSTGQGEEQDSQGPPVGYVAVGPPTQHLGGCGGERVSAWGGTTGPPTAAPHRPLTHVLQGAADGVGSLAPSQVPGEPKVGELEVSCRARHCVGPHGCPRGQGIPTAGMSPRQRRQTLTSLIQEDVLHLKPDRRWGGLSMLGRLETPSPHPLSPQPCCHPPSRLCARCPGRGGTLGRRWGRQSRGSPPGTVPPLRHPAGSHPPPGTGDPACGVEVALPSTAGHSPSTSTSSAANRRTVASAKRPAARHSACRSPVLQ